MSAPTSVGEFGWNRPEALKAGPQSCIELGVFLFPQQTMHMSDQNLEHLRHSLAHLLGAAIVELWPGSMLTLGPAIENGFYYDVDSEKKISEEDLPVLEAKMRELLKTWSAFEGKEVSAKEARAFAKNNPYKSELIDEIEKRGEPITLYTSGSFTDLCRGGHVEDAKHLDPKAFKLTKVAGAYWRGSEENKMLQRVYGVAFATKKELDAYLTMIEEAEKRDHRKLGVSLDLFTFSDLVGPGLPLWTPRGTLVRNLIDDFVWELRRARGYVKVEIPHITKKDLYETSGHWEKFKNELFRITTREGHEFVMKPMNCPHHTQIYARRKWSYRELPQRYANTTMVYRDEQSGELSGLSRVRSITQDDAHVFCRMSQFQEEALKIWDIVQTFYRAFDINLEVRLSLSDPAQPEKYLGDPKRWKEAEQALRDIAKKKGITAPVEGIGEAAFYGPKLDFMGKDAIGREHQVATIQLDFVQPERFNLTCTNEAGEDEGVVMIHAAIAGSLERFLVLAIEQYAGAFPVWLAPVQVAVIPVGESHLEVCRSLAERLMLDGIRLEIDESNETVGKKIRNSEIMKVPYALVVGDKEAPSMGQWSDDTMMSVRLRGSKDLLSISLQDFLARVNKQIVERRD